MNKREAILFLEKKRDKAIGYMSFFGEGNKESLMNEIRVNTYDIAINTLQQIDEPQAEKVEVPEFVAERMKYYESALWMLASEYFDSSSEIDSDELANWIDQNSEKFFRAWLDGYTVRPKRWVVKMATGYFMDFEEGCNEEGFEWVSSSKSCCLLFTDKPKADAVAVLVEGSVEEI